MAKKRPKGETMGQRLQRLRNIAGLSQAELARLAGIPVTTLRNWEQDRRQPRLDQAVKLARALNVSVDIIAGAVSEAAPERQPEA